jgi:hypothetical protein
MITFLNKSQLAWLLEIPAEDARAKMCVAWCKARGLQNKATRTPTGKIEDDYPDAMSVEMLSECLGIPDLQGMITDIEVNYLIRPAAKKYILCDYPEKMIRRMEDSGTRKRLSIPKALRTLVDESTRKNILKEWSIRYPKHA